MSACRVALVAVVLAGARVAAADPATASLQRELPHGWTLLATDTELVIRHDRAVYASAPPTAAPAPAAAGDHQTGPLIALELRYRLEPRWSAAQVAAARATNDRRAADLVGERQRLHIDDLPVVAGAPHASTADERARLALFARAETTHKAVALPVCALDGHSLFDVAQNATQLGQPVDPPQAMTEARAVVELVKRHCSPE